MTHNELKFDCTSQFDTHLPPIQYWSMGNLDGFDPISSPGSLNPSSSSSPTNLYETRSTTSPFPHDLLSKMSDDELAKLTVRELNQRLQGKDRKLVTALKQKRRTLKNRGYAFNCRVRRLQLQLQLEAENVMLKNEVRCMRQVLHQSQARLSYYEGSTVEQNQLPPLEAPDQIKYADLDVYHGQFAQQQHSCEQTVHSNSITCSPRI